MRVGAGGVEAVDQQAVMERVRLFAQHATGGDLPRLREIGKYAMQSLWEPVFRLGQTMHSPFQVDGRPVRIITGNTPTRYAIHPVPEGTPGGGHYIHSSITWAANIGAEVLHAVDIETGEDLELAPGSRFTASITVQVLPDGMARCVELPRVEATNVALAGHAAAAEPAEPGGD
jgi:hypothetical protein